MAKAPALTLTAVTTMEQLRPLLPTERMVEGIPAVIRGSIYHLHRSWWDWDEKDVDWNISISYPGSDQDGLFSDAHLPIWVIEVKG